MYLKQVLIENFLSYKGRTVIADLDKGLNVIIGCNGSGKSNVYKAIEFVLTDEFSNLSGASKRGLVTSLPGNLIRSTFVELLFAEVGPNSILTSVNGEVKIKRELKLENNQDEYFLNNSRISHVDLRRLLEEAKVTSKFPYNIVKQGFVAKLASLTDAQRMEIVQNALGMDQIQQINNTIAVINARGDDTTRCITEEFEALAEMRTDLNDKADATRKLLDLEKDKAALQYLIITDQIRKESAKVNALQVETTATVNASKDDTKKLDEALISVNALAALKKQIADEFDKANNEYQLKIRNQHELSLRMHRNLILIENATHDSKRSDTDRSNAIAINENKVRNAEQKIAELKERKKHVELELAQNIEKLLHCTARTRRLAEFPDKLERDAAINEDIDAINTLIKKQKHLIDKHTGILNQAVRVNNDKLNSINHALDRMDSLLGKRYAESAYSCKVNLQNCSDKTEQATQKLQLLKKTLWNLRHELHEIDSAGDKSVYVANQSFYSLLKQDPSLKVGYRGRFIDCFKYEQADALAIEAAAGVHLNFHIYDSVSVVKKVVAQHTGPGILAFLPLDSLIAPVQAKTKRAKKQYELLRRITYGEEVAKAMEFVFGNVLLCEDEVPVWTPTTSCRYVTPSGELFDAPKRRLCPQGSTLLLHQKRCEVVAKIEQSNAELEETNNNILSYDEAIKQLELEEAKGKVQENVAAGLIVTLSENVELNLPLLTQHYTVIQENERMLAKQHTVIDRYIFRRELLAGEINEVPPSDSETEESLQLSIRTLEVDNDALHQQLSEAFQSFHCSQNLVFFLRSQRIAETQTLPKRVPKAVVQQAQNELVTLKEELQAVTAITEAEKMEADSINRRLVQYEREQRQLFSDCKAIETRLHVTRESLEDIFNRKRHIQTVIADLETKLHEQVFPNEENVRKYAAFEMAQLERELTTVGRKIDQLASVDKSSIRLLTDLETQIDTFQNLVDLYADNKREMTDEANWDDKFEAELRQLNAAFGEHLQLLVPNAEAAMIRRGDGLALQVAFTPGHKQCDMLSLSGGQKCIVSIAFILALQTISPPPILVFDEIDAALDATWASVIAHMMHVVSDRVQILATTFKPHLLQYGDKFFGVTYAEVNKSSAICNITAETATNMLTE